MKLILTSFRARCRRRGWALLAVMVLAGCALMVLAGVMNWANQNSENTARNNEFFTTSYAAEAATEKVLASLSQQYQNYGFSLISQNMPTYCTTVPTVADGTYWTNYQFSGGHTINQVIVTNTATSQTIVMGAPYTGLSLVANTYEIIANAQNTTSQYKIVSTVGQQLNLGTIPLFQFAIFYQNDMEIAPGAAMTVSGAVHGNANIYLDPQNGLTFSNNVSAVDQVYTNQSPQDPSFRTFSGVTFDGFDLSGVDPLNLPVGTNTAGTVSNMSQNVYAILQPPQNGQSPSSSTGTNLLYNKADMIIIISNNNTISVTSGANINNQATVISNNQWQSFLSTNGTFYDQRDDLTVDPVVLNVSNLVNWSATNTVLRPVLSSFRGAGAADVQSIYVDDMRSTSNAVITTNYVTGTNYTTNSVTTASYPAVGGFVPPVTTNTISTTGSSYPFANTYLGSVVTNTATTTTSSAPASNTYTGSLTINTTYTVSVIPPSPGTYTGSVITNSHPTSYIYNLIIGYTYAKITGYSYNVISGYTYNVLNGTPYTNATYLTNWPIVSQPGIVLSNGAVLPPQGLSVATPDPAYIVGNWNIKLSNTGASDAGLNDTTYALPSAIYSDAVTILSSAWNPANSTAGINSRNATSDTVNAAFLTGNVPSNGSYYSGGVENFPRFLENWSGQTFTYNGSLVAMFSSQIATAPWPGTGGVYNPPVRNWAFDNNYSNPAKQPPMTPQVITMQRSEWTSLPPYTTSF
jgi:hypothetical protein